jgi:polyisoprenoid-binding protein YceI
MNTKLVSTLTGADYFDTANHPTAVFKATKVEASNVTADVTIKGVTKTLTFPVELTKDNEGYLLTAKINISRQDFGIAQTLAGKVALEDTFTLMLDKVAFMR